MTRPDMAEDRPNAADWRNRAERAEAECTELRATIERTANPTPTAEKADVVEAVALAILNENRRFSGLKEYPSLDGLPDHYWRDQRRQARAAIAALQSCPAEEWEGPLTLSEQALIDAAWEKHKAAGSNALLDAAIAKTRQRIEDAVGNADPVKALLRPAEPASDPCKLPIDVRTLVIAAREVWELVEFGALPDADQTKALDQALEAFSSRVPYADDPVQLPTGDPDHTDCDGPNGGGRFSHPALTPAPAAPALDRKS